MTEDQNLSFAVSPDGSTLMASRLTFPHLEMNPSPSPSGMPFTMSGKWALEILKAPAGGGSAAVLQRWEAPMDAYPDLAGAFRNIVVVGWDAGGPIALISSHFAIQNGVNSQLFFGGYLAYLDGSGNVGGRISPASDCEPQSLPTAGRIVCLSSNWQSVSVRALDGSMLRTTSAGEPPTVGRLSANGARLAMPGKVVVVDSGASLAVPMNFQPEAWLDDSTLIGTILGSNPQGSPYLGELRLQRSVTLEDWGFTGTIVGVIR